MNLWKGPDRVWIDGRGWFEGCVGKWRGFEARLEGENNLRVKLILFHTGSRLWGRPSTFRLGNLRPLRQWPIEAAPKYLEATVKPPWLPNLSNLKKTLLTLGLYAPYYRVWCRFLRSVFYAKNGGRTIHW